MNLRDVINAIATQSQIDHLRNLADIVRDGVEETFGDILWSEGALVIALLEDLAERTGNHGALETELRVVLSVDVTNEHIHRLRNIPLLPIQIQISTTRNLVPKPSLCNRLLQFRDPRARRVCHNVYLPKVLPRIRPSHFTDFLDNLLDTRETPRRVVISALVFGPSRIRWRLERVD